MACIFKQISYNAINPRKKTQASKLQNPSDTKKATPQYKANLHNNGATLSIEKIGGPEKGL